MVGTNQAEMPFLDHLEELRWRLFRVALAIAIACVRVAPKVCAWPWACDGGYDHHGCNNVNGMGDA